MLALLFVTLTPAQAVSPPASEVPISYLVSVVAYEGKCRFLPTDVGLTAQQLTTTLRGYNRSNGVQLVYYSGVPSECIEIGRKAAIAAGFRVVTARLATAKDEGHGRVPD